MGSVAHFSAVYPKQSLRPNLQIESTLQTSYICLAAQRFKEFLFLIQMMS